MAPRLTLLVSVLLALATGTEASAAATQNANVHRHHRAHLSRAAVAVAATTVPYRGLTVTRPPAAETAPDDQEIYQDGPVRYNDIRDFSPAPYTTSGVQYPYGLDGVGGYGSDLDFGGGQDSALYDRGAGGRP